MDERMNIVLGSSKEYSVYATVMLISLFENNKGEHFSIYYYYHEEMGDILENICKIVEEYGNCFTAIFVDEKRRNGFNVGELTWLNISTWYRYYCIEDLCEICDRVMLLGIDTIVTGNIRELYYEDMRGKSIIAITDMGVEYGFSVPDSILSKKYNPIKENHINSDVQIMDLKKIKGKIEVVDMVRLFDENNLAFLDQDVLNFFYRDYYLVKNEYKWNYIPIVANNCMNPNEAERIYEDVRIVHFAGSKPWNEPDNSKEFWLWYSYVEKSPYASEISQRVFKRYAIGIENRNAYIRKLERIIEIENKLWESCDCDWVMHKITAMNISSIAIFGIGSIGQNLLRYFKQNGVEIKGLIDNYKQGSYMGISIVQPASFSCAVDAIIVTAIEGIENVRDILKDKTCKLIYVSELLNDVI